MNDFLHGMAIRLACTSLPVRKVYTDVLDNEWPISWTSRSVKNNKTYFNGTMTFRRVSDAVGYDYANAAAAVTMVGDGFTETFTTENIGVTDTALGKLVYIQCKLSGAIFILALLVIETPGFEGAVEFTETGTYYAFLNSSYVNVEINNADVQFELTAPDTEKKLIGYSYNGVVLPELPETDLAYAAICSPTVFGIVDNNSFIFIATSAPLYVVKGAGSTSLKSADDVTYRSCSYDAEAKTWKQLSDEAIGTINKSWAVRWVNYDILNANGTVSLSASDPIPIYE